MQNDPFAKGRAIHAARVQARMQTPSVAAPTTHVGPMAGPDFAGLAKKFGADKLQLHQHPQIARGQIVAHLQSTLGPNYLQHPGVSDLLNAHQHQMNQATKHGLEATTTPRAKNIKQLLG